MKNFMKNTDQMFKFQGFISIVLGVIILIFIIMWSLDKMNLNSENCSDLNEIYGKNDTFISSFSPNNSEYQGDLRNYTIKTAYNCCASGKFKNDFVNLCALKNCIQQGARCLDFEIYSINDDPVIAASFINDYTQKGTYNGVPFEKAMSTIEKCAFNSGSECNCPNPNDPLILHFRIMSKNKKIYDKMAKILSTTLETKLLGDKYSYGNSQGHKDEQYFIGSEPLTNFTDKIIIAIEYSDLLIKSDLFEFTNICSNSPSGFMKLVRYSDLKNLLSPDELKEQCKKYFCICLPDISTSADNQSATLALQFGCQMIGMSFQNFDVNMQFYSEFFDDHGSAFVYQCPGPHCYIPLVVSPVKQLPKWRTDPSPHKPQIISFGNNDENGDKNDALLKIAF
tara:strand:+ start:616 stop:1800 length:1185 start_codon:yes stop_codon:yes gene_type:complete